MSSIHNIPEPTTGYRPIADEPTPAPESTTRRPDSAATPDSSKPETEVDAEVGGLTWLIALILCGLVLRAMLLYFGALTAPDGNAAAWVDRGHALIEYGPKQIVGHMPVYPMLALGLDSTGLPMWTLALLQCIVGMLAIPAGYAVGRRLTGSVLGGLGAAALLALHPGVLVWTTSMSPVGLAGGMLVLGLYLLTRSEKNEPTNVWPAAVLFGLAALTAPAAWLIGLGAACWCLAQGSGRTRGRLLRAGIVLALSIAPSAAWSAASGASLAPQLQAETTTATPRIASLADTSLREVGRQMRFEIHPHGTLTRLAEGRAGLPAERDTVADMAGDGWVLLNAALLLAAAVSLGLLLVRLRFATAALFAVPVLALLASGFALGEPERVVLFGPLALLAAAGLCTRAVPRLTTEAREQRAHDKELERQTKAETQQAKREKKHGLYAFDQPGKTPARAATATATGQALAGSGDGPETAISRPI